jgi:glycosyltransferase involved in cell wall biosynthesis
MKIVYINSFYAPEEVGGAEKSVRFLAEAMVAKGHEASVITLGRERQTAELNGVRIERLPVSNLYHPLEPGAKPTWKKMAWHGIDSYNLSASRAVAQVLDQWRPDVAHTNNVAGFSVAVWRRLTERRIAIVHTLRDYYMLCPNTAMFKNGQPCAQRCLQCKVLSAPRGHATGLVQTVIGNSRFILDKHKAHGLFPNAQADVIYNAYSPGPHMPERREPQRMRFGYIGRIAPTKGVETLIDAARLAAEQGHAFEALIAGDGDEGYLDALRTRSAGAPVTFLGRVKPEVFYSQIDWTIVPSLWDEPLARVIFESFCHGVPVIGSTTGGTPELVVEGRNGRLFAPGDVARLTAIMAEACTGAMDAQAYKAHSKAGTDTFSPLFVSGKYEQSYAQAIETLN